MILKQIPIQPQSTRNFSYLAVCERTGSAVLFDPAFEAKKIMRELNRIDRETSLEYILNTHGHHDHVHANQRVKNETGAKIGNHPADRAKRDFEVEEHREITAGDIRIRTLHTPGHSPGSCCFLLNDDTLITGDTLFVGKVGGTDNRGKTPRQQYESIHNKIMSLPMDTTVFPGHDYGPKPSSTLSWESRYNPFVLRTSFVTFCELKENWKREKKKWEQKWKEVT